VHVRGRVDPGLAHRSANALGYLLHHRGPADVFRQDFRADGGADHEALLARRSLRAVPGEHGGVGRDHAVAAAGPHHRDPADQLGASFPVLGERGAKRLIGQDAREVVDAAVAFGLADDGHHVVRAELAGEDPLLQAGSVLHVLENDLRHLDRHR